MKIEEHAIPSLILAGKDEETLAVLYKRVFPKVKRYIVAHGGNEEDGSDMFQDALMLFYKQVVTQKFDESKYTVYGYVFRLSINRWLNKLKKDKRMSLVDVWFDKDFNHEIDDSTPTLELVGKDENVLHKLFSNIGEKCLELLNYTIYNNLMIEDIVIRMDFASEGAVKMQLKRCKQKLRAEVEKNPKLINYLKNV